MVQKLRVVTATVIFFVLMVGSCASDKQKKTVSAALQSADSFGTFSYTDISGSFSLRRKVSYQRKRLFFQRILYQDTFEKWVEKLRSISQVGGIYGESGVYFRPLISQIELWMEGKKFSNQIKLNIKTKSLDIVSTGKSSKAQRTQVSLPTDVQLVCFFQELPECLKLSGVLRQFLAKERMGEVEFVVIMETYPFHDVLYSDLPNQAFFRAKISVGSDALVDSKRETVLNVLMGDQVVNLKFQNNGNFLGLFWVSQGISMVPSQQ